MNERAQRLERWERWLDSHSESALEPSLPVIDPHHHLWDRGGHRYLIGDYRYDARHHHVISSVYVECLWHYRDGGPVALRPVGESEHVGRLADAADECGAAMAVAAGIVGYADLRLGATVDRVLDAHRAAAGARFKGVRFPVAFDEDPAVHGAYPTTARMLGEAAVVEAVQVLMRGDLTLDLWLYFHQLGEAANLARRCPGLTVVIDHLGGPLGVGNYTARRAEVFDAWRAALAPFRDLPQVVMKFGGLAMPLAGFGWRERPVPPSSLDLATAWRPYFEVCVDVFGPRRLMFESNFPVDRSGCSYTVLWNAFKRLSMGLSDGERADLFGMTARRVYRLS